MTLLPFLLAYQTTHYVTPDPVELSRVKEFVREAFTALDPNETLPAYEMRGEPVVEASDSTPTRTRSYTFNNATVWIKADTGRIWHYFGPGPTPHEVYNPDGTLVPRAVSNAAAATLARRFLLAAGQAGDLAVTRVVDPSEDDPRDLQVEYEFSAGGVPYDLLRATLDLDRQTGGLHRLTVEDLVPPPAALAPLLPLDAGRALALRAGVDLREEALAELPGEAFRLVVWDPHAGRPEFARRYSATARAAQRANRGVLAYVGWLRGGSYESGVRVAVDARTGEVLDRQDAPPWGGVGGFHAPAERLAVPAAPRPWRVAFGKSAWSGPATAALTAVPGAVPSGRRVLLTDGRLALPATYDARTGLVGVNGEAYHPGAALAGLLRRKSGAGQGKG